MVFSLSMAGFETELRRSGDAMFDVAKRCSLERRLAYLR